MAYEGPFPFPIHIGGTSKTSVTTSPAATSWAGWDANLNLSSNSFISGYATTVTAAGTTTLVVGSKQQQFFTGSTTQTVVMPVVSTLVLGQSFTIVNNSSGVVTVQSSGANTIQAMAASTNLVLTVIAITGTTAASWNIDYSGLGLPLISGLVTGMTSGAASTIATITNASNSVAGGTLTYSIESSDGTDFQLITGQIAFSLVNKATVVTSNILNLGGEASAVSAGTLTAVFSFSGANLQVTPTTSLTPTILQIKYSIISNSQQAISVP